LASFHDQMSVWQDAHLPDGKRFVVRADEKLMAFVELESVIFQLTKRPSRLYKLLRLIPHGCAAERLPSTIRPHAPAARQAITMSRLIPRKKVLGSCLRSSSLLTRLSVQHRGRNTRPFIDLLRKRRNQVPEILDFFRLPALQKLSIRLEIVPISIIVVATRLVFFKS
jgi:hypothetical protein